MLHGFRPSAAVANSLFHFDRFCLFIYLVAVVVCVRSEREDSRLENILTLTLSFKKTQNARTSGMCFRNILSLSIGHTLHWGATGFFFFFLSRTAVNKRRRAIAAKVSVLLKKRLQPWQPRD